MIKITRKEFSDIWDNIQQIYPDDLRLNIEEVQEEYFNSVRIFSKETVKRIFGKAIANNNLNRFPPLKDMQGMIQPLRLKMIEERMNEEHQEDPAKINTSMGMEIAKKLVENMKNNKDPNDGVDEIIEKYK